MHHHPLVLRPRPNHREEERREAFVDEQTLRRVAHAGTLRLRVVENGKRHREIGLLVHIDMAHALVVLQDRHERGLAHCADEPLAATRNGDIDKPHRPHEFRDGLVVERVNEQDGVGKIGGGRERLKTFRHGLRERRVRLERFLAAAQDDGVARLQSQRGGVNEDVGTTLEDDGENAERHGDFLDRHAVLACDRLADDTDGIGQIDNLANPRDHRVHPRFVERQTVDERGREVCRPRLVEVASVGGGDVRPVRLKRVGDRRQGRVLRLGGQLPQSKRGPAGAAGERENLLLNRFHFSTPSSPPKRPDAPRPRGARRRLASRPRVKRRGGSPA